MFNKNLNTQLAQYILSRQKSINGLLEKSIFTVITTENILSNAQILNSRFIDEIKNLSTDKT